MFLLVGVLVGVWNYFRSLFRANNQQNIGQNSIKITLGPLIVKARDKPAIVIAVACGGFIVVSTFYVWDAKSNFYQLADGTHPIVNALRESLKFHFNKQNNDTSQHSAVLRPNEQDQCPGNLSETEEIGKK